MERLKILERAELNPEQGRVYDAALAGGGVVGGPYYAYIRLPQLFEAAQDLRTVLGALPLTARERQIVNITVARHWDALYPWAAQSRGALQVGVPQDVIDAINARRTPDLPDARERTCHAVAAEMLAHKGLSDASYRAAKEVMGEEHLVALVTTVGYFSMTCLVAGTFQIPAPPNTPIPLAR